MNQQNIEKFVNGTHKGFIPMIFFQFVIPVKNKIHTSLHKQQSYNNNLPLRSFCKTKMIIFILFYFIVLNFCFIPQQEHFSP